MSAWLCSEDHLSCIVNAVDGTADHFKTLLAENLRSLAARYPGRDFLADWQADAKTYRFNPLARYSPTQVVKSCDSYDYQACETDDYRTTLAATFVQIVREHAIAHGGATKGFAYDKADWSL